MKSQGIQVSSQRSREKFRVCRDNGYLFSDLGYINLGDVFSIDLNLASSQFYNSRQTNSNRTLARTRPTYDAYPLTRLYSEAQVVQNYCRVWSILELDIDELHLPSPWPTVRASLGCSFLRDVLEVKELLHRDQLPLKLAVLVENLLRERLEHQQVLQHKANFNWSNLASQKDA